MVFHGLLLASGFSNPVLLEKVRTIAQTQKYTKAHIITTAHPKKERSPWNKITKQQLEEIGMSVSFVDFDADESLDADVDLIYVCGGNTFHLLSSVQQTSVPVREQIAAMCARGGLYIGSSAGSIMATPSIESAGEVHPDKNRDGVTDFQAFGFIQRHIIPHYTENLDPAIRKFCTRHARSLDQIVLLRDGEGLYVTGNEETVIS